MSIESPVPEPKSDSRTSFLIELRDAPGALESVLRHFSDHQVNLTHIESRPARGETFDFFVDCEGSQDDRNIESLVEDLRQHNLKVLVLDHRKVPWFPRHVGDLDLVANQTLDAGTELESDHPGFQDPAYRAQRSRIDALARAYRYGDPIPEVEYSAEERSTWRTVCERLQELRHRFACREYRQSLETLRQECDFGPERIPQIRELSAFLESRTGFRLRPVAGLLSARHFLNGLAFRVMFSTQYIRHHSKPLYTPEPDICHELIGHAPMFADPAFAELSQEIGLASLGAGDAEIEQLARCYWFSVEFGLIRQDGELRAYGAGLLSSFGELAYACGHPPQGAPDPDSEQSPTYVDWEPNVAAHQEYPITTYQPRYFVADSLYEAKERIRRYCAQLPRSFYARHNPINDRIWVDRAVEGSRSVGPT
ncbi:MAG: ACT domain-containing protein [Myxococcota bacterium]